jgi:uncharacterized membrane protein
MGITFWIKRFVLSFVVAFAVLLVVQWLKRGSIHEAITYGLLWGAITAAVYTLVGYIRYKRNPACMVRTGH